MTDSATRTTDALADADWLEARLGDPSLQVVEVDVSGAAHGEGHIPGAVLWNIYEDLRDEHYQPRPDGDIHRLIEKSGIVTTSTVVFYGYAPALGFWIMHHLGHEDIHILDLGRDAWESQRRPWTTEETSVTPSEYAFPSAPRSTRSTIGSLIEGNGARTAVDVRSDLEYAGERFWPSGGSPEGGRAGHIPGARHVSIDGVVSPDGSFLSAQQLRGLRLPILGIQDTAITTYCTVGARAATAWFVLTQILGHADVRVYDGSWAEWGLTPSTPIER